MANIKIDNLRPAGADLLSDSESYLTDLNQDELNVQGGLTWVTVVIVLAGSCGAAASGANDPRKVSAPGR